MALATALAFVMAGAAVACSDDDRPAASSSSSSGNTPSEGGTSAEGSTSEGGTITARPDLCEGLALGGSPALELELPGTAPEPLGGEIPPGTYDLTELYTYAPPDPEKDAGDGETPSTRLTGNAAQATLVVTKFEMRIIEARGTSADGGLGAPTTRALLYRVDGKDVVATEVCPKQVLPARIPFSTVGGGLALFPDATHREVYTPRAQ